MKNSRKKLAVKIIAVILAVVLIAVGLFGGYLLYRFSCNKSNTTNSYDAVYEAEQVKLSTDSNGIFKVLKINDTHFFDGVCENDKHTLDDLKAILDKTPCDLIVVDGDLVDGFNLKTTYDKFGAINLFANLIEEYNIPWTFAPGNNDFEIDGSNEDIIAFMMQYEHFVFGNKKNVDGSMQFMIDVYNNDKLVHSIAVMDSGARKPKAIGPYQPISENQANWLNDEVNSRGVKTSVFFHMPTTAFQTAYDDGEAYDGFDMYNTYPYDEIKNDDVFDNVIKDNNNITLISCAHQHSNNMCSFYNNRYYQLSSVSGYSAGRNDFIYPSCTLTVINTLDDNVQTMYSFEQIRA
ncbi:MAG: metallophosphoesterase [Eubacterium sp.]|nr:metallophosphoesterase [Eubacterium sp.]